MDSFNELEGPGGLFRQVLLNEPVSVSRLVWFVMHQTQAGQPYLEASYSDLQRELNLSRCGVSEGLHRAIEKGYVVKLAAPGDNHRARYTLPANTLPPITGSEALPDQSANQTERNSNLESLIESSLESVGAVWKTDQEGNDELGTMNDEPKSRSGETRPGLAGDSTAFTAPNSSVIIHRSSFLDRLCRDFSRELGDLAHLRSNRTQVLNLWQASALAESEFARLLYQSRDLTRRHAVLRPGEPPPPSGQPRNRMAYFFAVVRDLLGRPARSDDRAANTPRPGPNQPPATAAVKDQHQSYRAGRSVPASWLAFA